MLNKNYPNLGGTAQKLDETVAQIVENLKNRTTYQRFDSVRNVFKGVELFSSFSHNTINLPGDELWGNVILRNLNLENIVNIAYDHSIPKSDKPVGHRIQTLNKESIDILENKYVPYAFQEKVRKLDGEVERIKQSYKASRRGIARFEELIGIYNKYSSEYSNSSKVILNTRRDIMCSSLGMKDLVDETAFSAVRNEFVSSLEELAVLGYPFYDIDLSRTEFSNLLRYINGEREAPLYREGKTFLNGDVEIPLDDTFKEMKSGKVIPSVPVILLGLTVGPQIPHLGGSYFKNYAPSLVEHLSEFLGIDRDTNSSLVLTTNGYNPLVRLDNKQSVFVYYPELGRETILEAVGYD